MAKARRVMCPRCGGRVRVTPLGKFREHRSVADKICGSSGQPVDAGGALPSGPVVVTNETGEAERIVAAPAADK